MLTPTEKLNICSTCSKRAFSREQGLICGETGKKPEFIDDCHEYHLDKNVIDRKKSREDSQKNSEISGFLAFFVYWSIPISLVWTLALAIVPYIFVWESIHFKGNIFLILFEVAILGFYCYFQLYTIYGFRNKKQDVVFIAKYQLIVVAITNIIALATGITYDGFRYLHYTSVVWSIIFLIYLYRSEDVEYLIPRSSRKLKGKNKLLVILSIVIPIILFILAIFESARKVYDTTTTANYQSRIEEICKDGRAQLPQEVSEGINLVDIFTNNDNIVFSYEYTDYDTEQAVNWSNEYKELVSLYQKELSKASFGGTSISSDSLLIMGINAGYGLTYTYKTSEEDLYSYTLTNEECITLFNSDYSYSTSDDCWKAILSAFNRLMPIEYFQGGYLNSCNYINSELHYSLNLKGLDLQSLMGLSDEYLKNYIIEIIPYFSDAPFILAQINNIPIVYDFSSDCSLTWKKSIIIMPEEYNVESIDGGLQ